MCFWIQAMHSIWTTGKWSQPFWWWTSPVSNHWKLLCATMAHENKNILLVLTVLTEIKFIIHTFTLLFDDILHTVPNSFKNKKPSPPKKKNKSQKITRWVSGQYVVWAWNPQQHRKTPGKGRWCHPWGPEELHQAFSLISKVLRFARAGHGNLPIADQADLMKGVEVMDEVSLRNGSYWKWGKSLKKRKEIPNLETSSAFSGSSRSNFWGV